jgi:hypothetical protein
VRVSYDLESKTPDGTVRRAYRTSDDGFTWNAPVEFGAAYSGAEGWSWGTSYDTPVVTNQIVEYGLNVKNAQNANVEMFQVVAPMLLEMPSALRSIATNSRLRIYSSGSWEHRVARRASSARPTCGE